MNRSEEYRKYADECARLAREAEDEAQRQVLLEIADAWTQEAAREDGKLPAAALPTAPRARALPRGRARSSSRRTGGKVVPITPFLTGEAFGPKAIQNMSAAYVRACESLHLKIGDDPTTRLVAKKIIELAQHGIRDPETLRIMTLNEFNLADRHGLH